MRIIAMNPYQNNNQQSLSFKAVTVHASTKKQIGIINGLKNLSQFEGIGSAFENAKLGLNKYGQKVMVLRHPKLRKDSALSFTLAKVINALNPGYSAKVIDTKKASKAIKNYNNYNTRKTIATQTLVE